MADIDITVVRIDGLDAIEEAFTGGSWRAIRKFLRRVEFKAAKVLVDAAEAAAPYETGKLEGSIHRQTVSSAAEGSVTVRVGPGQDAFYGAMQEWGAPAANIMPTHWLENAARAVQDEVLTEFYEGLREGLEDMKK